MGTNSEPYRLFFPLGALFGLWGVSLWIAFGTGLTTTYPGALHATVMMGGFLGAFAFGFLTTAVPRLTRSFPIRRFELFLILTPLVWLPVLAATGSIRLVDAALCVSFCGVFIFLAIRFRRRTHRPPDSFVFVGVGIVCGFIGTLIGAFSPTNPEVLQLGQLLYFYGFIPSLVLGVGSRLIPVLLGQSTMADMAAGLERAHAKIAIFFASAAVFTSAFFIEVWLSAPLGKFLRFIVILWIALYHWRIWRLPMIRTIVAWLVWSASWFCVLGFSGQLLFPELSIHFAHLVFIGGLGLMTLMIATRVVLAHGGFNLILESRLKSLWAVGVLLVAASVTRFSAGWLPAFTYQHHLLYASYLWVIGLAVWVFSVGRRLAFPILTAPDKRSC